jgi:hypothetical protein
MLLHLAADNMMNDFDEIFKHHPCLKCACGYRAPWGPHAISLANKSPRLWWLPAQALVSVKHLAHQIQNPIQITTCGVPMGIVSCPTITLHRVGACFTLEL